MNPQTPNLDPAELSGFQRRVFDAVVELSPDLASMYLGAILAFQQRQNPAIDIGTLDPAAFPEGIFENQLAMALVFTLIKANSWGWSSGWTLAGFSTRRISRYWSSLSKI